MLKCALVAFVGLAHFRSVVSFRVSTDTEVDSVGVGCSADDVLYAEGAPSDFENNLVDLTSHHLFNLLGTGVDASALQTCYNLHQSEQAWKMDWKKKMIDKLVSFSQLALDSSARGALIQPLVANVLNWQQSGADKLMTWAFEHKDGMNPFCAHETKVPSFQDRMELRRQTHSLFMHFGHLLVSGHETDSSLDEVSGMVNETLSFLITKAIGATMTADCSNHVSPHAASRQKITWDTSFEWPPVVKRSFELLQEAPASNRERYFLQELVNAFQSYVKTLGVDLFSPELTPEIEGLWQMLKESSGSSERVYANAQKDFNENPAGSGRPKSCQCIHIAHAMSSALNLQLSKLGFDADRAEENWLWDATDLMKMLDLFILTEEGSEDPNLSFLHLLHEANRLPRLPVEQQDGVSKESQARSLVKAVLVGLPMLQNYLAHLDVKHGADPSVKVNYAKKVKWFLFLNIAWAVWHENTAVGLGDLQRVSLKHRQQNVAMGLLVSAFAVVSDFSWDGKLFKEENLEAFNDFNVGLYTVWNYRWVSALFEPRRLQFHFWHGLGLPVLESLGNHNTSAYWVNYRRDGLMAAMMNLSPLPQDELQ